MTMTSPNQLDKLFDREAVIDSRSDSVGGTELFHKLEVNEISRKSVG